MKTLSKIYKLESVDTDNYTGVLKVKKAYPKNSKWTTINVRLSGLLRSRIIKNDNRDLELGDTLVGTSFESTNLSKKFHENPFTLVKYTPVKDSDIPENYVLRLVNQEKGILEEMLDFFGDKEERWHNKKQITYSKYFSRFLEIETEEKLENLEYGVVIP